MIKVKDLLKYRSVWMTFSILFIMLTHSGFHFPGLMRSAINAGGVLGVDTFIFASGLGCAFSLCKNSDALSFYSRRASKILPTYWFFMLFWVAGKLFLRNITPLQILGNLFGIEYFSENGNAFNWYISSLLVTYLIAPVLVAIAQKCRKLSHYFLAFAILFLMTVSFWRNDTLMVVIARFPIFFLGIGIGVWCNNAKEERTLSYEAIAGVFGLMIVGLVFGVIVFLRYKEYGWSFGLDFYPYILVVPGTCVFVSLICRLLEKCRVGRAVVRVLEFIGGYTFEIYLVHLSVFRLVTTYSTDKGITVPNSIWCVVFLIACVLAALFCFLKNGLLRLWAKRSKKKTA